MKKETNQLNALVKSSGLPMEKTKEIADGLSRFFEMASEWAEKIETIVVEHPTQKGEMKIARESRLMLRGYRLEAEKNIKEKRDFLKNKMADDILLDKLLLSANKMIKATYENLEGKLEEKEKFAERFEAEQRALLLENRLNIVLRYILPDDNLEQIKEFCLEATEDDFNKFVLVKKQANEEEKKRLENVRRQEELIRAGFQYDTKNGNRFYLHSVNVTPDEIINLSREDFENRLKDASQVIADIQREKEFELLLKEKENEALRIELAQAKELQQKQKETSPEPIKSVKNEIVIPEGTSESEKLKLWVDSFQISTSPVASSVAFDISTKFSNFKKWAFQQIEENVKK